MSTKRFCCWSARSGRSSADDEGALKAKVDEAFCS